MFSLVGFLLGGFVTLPPWLKQNLNFLSTEYMVLVLPIFFSLYKGLPSLLAGMYFGNKYFTPILAEIKTWSIWEGISHTSFTDPFTLVSCAVLLLGADAMSLAVRKPKDDYLLISVLYLICVYIYKTNAIARWFS